MGRREAIRYKSADGGAPPLDFIGDVALLPPPTDSILPVLVSFAETGLSEVGTDRYSSDRFDSISSLNRNKIKMKNK